MFHKRIRVWHKENKKMYKVAAIDFENQEVTLHEFLPSSNVKDTFKVYFKGIILMQESGLQDDKNFNVFEADLIKFEDELFILNYGHYGDTRTKVNGYGWFLNGKKFTFLYVGGGEKVGNFFENPELVTT